MDIREPQSLEEAVWMAERAIRFRDSAAELERAVVSALPRLRAEAGVTQGAVAKRSSVSQAYVSQIETGERGSSSPQFLNVVRGLASAADDLARARKQGG